MQEPRLEGVARIAVLRCNGLGDLVFSLPGLEALRAAYPGAEIALLGRPWARELLEGRPAPVDRVVPVPVARGVREEPATEEDPAEVAAFREAMRAERLDLALQWHGGGRTSNPFVLALGARATAGSCTPDAPRLDRWLPYQWLQPEVPRYLELAALVGAPPVTVMPRLAPGEGDAAAASRLLDGLGPPVALLHPGASDPRRRWPPERFAAVGDALAARGAAVVVTGAPPERALVERVRGVMRAPARALAPALGELPGLLAACDVVVGNDSGPLHLAGAMGTATVGLYWGPNLVNSPPPWRARHRALAAFASTCPECGADVVRAPCGHESSLLEEVPAAEAAAAAEELLGLEPGDPDAHARALDPRAAGRLSSR